MPWFHNRTLCMSKELGSTWITNFTLGEMVERKTKIVAWNKNKKQTKIITIMHKFNNKQRKTTTRDFVSILQRFWVKSIPLHSQCTFHLELLCIFPWILLFPLQTNVTLPCWKTSMSEGLIFPLLFGAIVIPFSN